MFSIQYIILVFKNEDTIKIDGKNIGYLLLDDIKKSARNSGYDSFEVSETPQLIGIEIKRDANLLLDGIDSFRHKVSVFDRITSHDDISYMLIVDNDDNVYEYDIPWSTDEHVNEYQKSTVGRNRNLYITISPEKTIRNSFFKDYLNDSSWDWVRTDWGENS